MVIKGNVATFSDAGKVAVMKARWRQQVVMKDTKVTFGDKGKEEENCIA